MKRRTHPVQKSGISPWQRYKKGKGGGTGGIGPGSMWLDRTPQAPTILGTVPTGTLGQDVYAALTPSLAHDLVHGDLTIDLDETIEAEDAHAHA